LNAFGIKNAQARQQLLHFTQVQLEIIEVQLGLLPGSWG
jgi:hypothetical protein